MAMQGNPFDQFDAAPAPAPGPIMGPPPKPEAPKEPKTTYRPMTPEEVKTQGLDPAGDYQINSEGKIDAIPGRQSKPTEAQQKIATLTTRIAGGFSDIKSVTSEDKSAQEPGLLESVRGGLSPEGFTGPIVRKVAGANRRTVFDAQSDVLDALLTLGTGAAYNKEQLTGQMSSYFPQYGDTPQEINVKNQRMLRLIEAAKANAGPAWEQVEGKIAPFVNELAVPQGEDDGLSVGGAPEGQVLIGYRKNEDGTFYPIYGQAENGGGPGDGGGGDGGEPLVSPDVAAKADRIQAESGDPGGMAGISSLAQRGISLGLSDEAAGAGGFLANLVEGKDPRIGYEAARDARRRYDEEAQKQWPVLGRVAEFLGGGGAGKVAEGATTLAGAIKGGASMGSLAGYGYGEGAQGSSLGALAGGVMGGGLGAAAQGVSSLASRAASRNAPDLSVIQAGERQGVPIRQPDVRPELRGQYAALESTEKGGPMIGAAREQDAAAIANRAAEVAGGKPFDRADQTALGQSVQGIAERGQKSVKEAAGGLYTRAERLAPGFKTPANQTTSFIDSKIAELKARSPTGYDAEVKALEAMRSDLAQTGLSVETLQAQRETIGGRIGDNVMDRSRADKTFTEVLKVAQEELHSTMKAANPQAAEMLKRADAKYSQYKRLQGEVSSLFLGKRGEATAETASRALNAATRNNYSALRRFMTLASPEEKADFASTFVQNWGASQRGEFSPAVFAKSMEKVSDRTLNTILGSDGRSALRDLQAIANAKTDAMSRQSPSGKAIGNAASSLKTMLMAALGYSTGGVGGAAAGAVAKGMISAWGEQRAARMLLNPNFTKLLRAAPDSTDPVVINRYLAKLSAIRGVAANDNAAFTNALMQAMGRSPAAGVAAKGDDNQDVRREPVGG